MAIRWNISLTQIILDNSCWITFIKSNISIYGFHTKSSKFITSSNWLFTCSNCWYSISNDYYWVSSFYDVFLSKKHWCYFSYSCVISTMCLPDLELQLVNPTTQVSLFSLCSGSCSSINNITWNIYFGIMNSSSNFTQWTLFNKTNQYQNIWFFGKDKLVIFSISFHMNYFKVHIQVILQQ